MGEWRYASYKRKGLSHLKEGIECQDNTFVVDTEEYLVAALADGLGSLKYSEVASDIATKSVCKAFENLNCSVKEVSSYLLQHIVSDIQQEANSKGLPLKEMDCTLVFVCIYKKEPKVIVGRLGDSAICIFCENQAIALNDGNQSANGTSAILDRDAVANFTINAYNYKKEKITGFILSSDGLENILYMKGSTNVNKAAEEYFNTLVTSDSPELEIGKKISRMVSVPDSPFDDDISIIVIGRNDEPISLPEDATWLCKCGCRNPLYATYCINCNCDFTILYEKVKFKEYGGKAAFFKKINKYPEQEKRMLGIKAESRSISSRNIENTTLSRKFEVDDKNAIHTRSEGVGIDEQIQVLSRRRTVVEDGLPCTSYDLRRFETHKNPENANNYVVEKKTQHLMSKSKIESDESIERTDNIETTFEKRNRINDNANIFIYDESLDDKHNEKSVRKNKKNWGYIVLLGMSVFLSLSLGIVLACAFLSNSIREKSEEIARLNLKINLLESENKNEQVGEDSQNYAFVLEGNPCIVLDSGNYYWGKLDNNKPHGLGILQEDNKYYIGQFCYGKKNGEFTVVDSHGCKNVFFDNDEIVK